MATSKWTHSILIGALLVASSAYGQDAGVVKTKKTPSYTSLWATHAWFGVQMLPDYAEDGTNQGFKRSKPYVAFKSVARWRDDNDPADGKVDDTTQPGDERTFGFDVVMMGAGSVDKSPSDSMPASFNDVSQTLDASVYADVAPEYFVFTPGSSVAIEVIRLGFVSLDKQQDDGSTVNKYARAGLVYRYFDDPNAVKNDKRNYQRGSFSSMNPKITIQWTGGWYEEYAARHNAKRNVFDVEFLLSEEHRWYLGATVNAGSGPDDYSLRLAAKSNIDDVLKLFGLGTE